MNRCSRLTVFVSALLVAGLAQAGINSWTMTGPEGGPASAIAIHPTQPQIAIAGTPRGLYRTTNGGNSWTMVAEQVYPAAQRIVFDPTNPNRVFAVNGTLWRSDDAGQSFAAAPEPVLYNSLRIEITPAGTIYLGSTYAGYFFKSTNQGSTWTACGHPFGNGAESVAFGVDPNSSDPAQDRLYVAIRNNNVPGISGTWRSIDGCASWIPAVSGSPGSGIQDNVTRYAVMPGNSNRVLAGSTNGLALSNDAGVTWALTWHWNIWWIEFDPTTPGRVFAMERISRILRSTDNGSSWNFGGSPGVHGPVQIALDPQVPGRMFFTSNNGPMLSTDLGGQFALRTSGIRAGTPGTLAAANDGTVYTTLAPGAAGVFRRDPVTGAWGPVNNAPLVLSNPNDPVTMSHVAVAPTDSSRVFTSIFGNYYFRSTTGGASWESPHPTFLAADAHPSVTTIDPHNPQIAYASTITEGLWKTVDGGVTWNRANTGLASWVGAVAIDPANSDVAYVPSVPAGGTSPDQVFKTTNGGLSWSPTGAIVPTPNTNEYVVSLTVDPFDSNVVYASHHNQVVKTTNGSVSWNPMTFPPETSGGRGQVLVDPVHAGVVIIPTGSRGFLRTVDGGVHWTETPVPTVSAGYLVSATLNPLRPNMIIGGTWGASVAEYEIATDLSVAVSGIDATLPSSDTVHATVTVRNLGIHAAWPPLLTIVIPDWITPTVPVGCTRAAQTVTCNVGPLQPGAERVYQLPLAVSAAGGSGALVANVANAETELDPANNSAIVAIAAAETADLSVTLAANPAPLDRGATTTLVATLTNHGPSVSNNTGFSMIIPTGLNLLSASSARGGCTPASIGAYCNIGTMAVDESLIVTVQISATAAGTHSIAGTVDGDGIDGDLDQYAALRLVVRPVGDIGVTLVESTDPVTLGVPFEYVATVTHHGGDAGPVTLNIPVSGASVSGASATAGTCSSTATTVSCALTPAAGGSSIVTVNLSSVTPGITTATATAIYAGTDSNPGNNTANIGTTMLLVADLSVDLAESGDPINVGAPFRYTATLRNAGPNDGPARLSVPVTGATVSGVTASSGTCTLSATNVTCTAPSLASGGMILVTMDLTVTTPGTVTATATAELTGVDPVSTNNSASISTTARPAADIGVTLTESADPVALGVPFQYVATVTHHSGDPGGVVLSIPVTGASVIGATATAGTCTTTSSAVSCALTPATNGSSTVTVSLSSVLPGIATATATAIYAGTDSNPGNNTANIGTTMLLVADLSVDLVESGDPINVGAPFSYTATLRNAGPNDGPVRLSVPVTGATVSGVTASSGTCALSVASVICTTPSLASGAMILVTIDLAVATPGTVAATATAELTGVDPVSTNNSASISTTARPVADISVDITDSVDPATAGTPFSYNVTVGNLGPSAGGVQLQVPTTGVSVTAAVPSTGTCTHTTSAVTCDFASLASGASATVRIDVSASAAGAAQAVATAAFAGFDPGAVNDRATASTTVVAAPPAGGGSSSSSGGRGGGGRLDWVALMLLGALALSKGPPRVSTRR